MTPAVLLQELRAVGAALRVRGGRLEAKHLPPHLAALTKAHAAELRRLLAGPVPAVEARALPEPSPAPELDPSAEDPPPPGSPIEAPGELEAPGEPAVDLADTPEAWAAFLRRAPWLTPSERRRILADVRGL